MYRYVVIAVVIVRSTLVHTSKTLTRAHTLSAVLRVHPMSKLTLDPKVQQRSKQHDEYNELDTLGDLIDDMHTERMLGKLKEVEEHLLSKMVSAEVPAAESSLTEGAEVLVYSDGFWRDGEVVSATGGACTFTTSYGWEVTLTTEYGNVVLTNEAENYLAVLALWSQVNFKLADLLLRKSKSDLLLSKNKAVQAQQHATCALQAFRFCEPFHLRGSMTQYLRLVRMSCLCAAAVAKGNKDDSVASNFLLLVNQFKTELEFHVLKPFEVPPGSSTEVVMRQLVVLDTLFVEYMQEQGEEDSVHQLEWQP